jgi:hypothetical protein
LNLKSIVDAVRDPYERKARVVPGLLVALPLLVPIACIAGPKNPTIMATVGLLSACGVIYALSNVVRGLGKAKEEQLVTKWGGMPTTIMLRHRDTTLESPTRALYHQLIAAKLNQQLPTAAAELENPAAADDAYKAAARQLRELTRGKQYSLLLKENIAYGFHRNMYGARVLGWTTSTLGILIGLVLSKMLTLQPIAVHPEAIADPSLSGALTLGIALPVWLAWFHFGPKQVRRIADVYAERLFEALRTIPKPRAASKKKGSGQAEVQSTL